MPAARSPARRRSPCSTSSPRRSCIDRANLLGDRIKGELTRDRPAQRHRGDGRASAVLAPWWPSIWSRAAAATEPDADATKRVTQAAIAKGLVLLSCGVHANTIRILMPLTVSDAILAEGLGKLEKALVAANA